MGLIWRVRVRDIDLGGREYGVNTPLACPPLYDDWERRANEADGPEALMRPGAVLQIPESWD
jgi:hypothetical protein